MPSATDVYNRGENPFAELKPQAGWLLALSIAFIVLGTIGVLSAVLFTIASVLLFGALLVIGAVLQLVEAYRTSTWKRRLPHVLIGLIYAAGGIIMLVDPLDASVALTLILAIALIAIGALRMVFAFQIRGSGRWGWALAAGIASVLLGILILAGWPQTALWVIGLLVAIDLIVNGWMLLFIALAARRA